MKRPEEEIPWDITPFICLFNIFSLVSLDTFHIPVSMSRPFPYDSLQPGNTHREDFSFWPWKGTHYQNCPPSVITRKQHEILATDQFRHGIMGGTGRGAQSQAILLRWGGKTGDRRPWQLEFAGHSPWEKEATQRKFQKSAYISLESLAETNPNMWKPQGHDDNFWGKNHDQSSHNPSPGSHWSSLSQSGKITQGTESPSSWELRAL